MFSGPWPVVLIVVVTHSDGRPRARQGQAEWRKADELTRLAHPPGRAPAYGRAAVKLGGAGISGSAGPAGEPRDGGNKRVRSLHGMIRVTHGHAVYRAHRHALACRHTPMMPELPGRVPAGTRSEERGGQAEKDPM